MPAEAILDIAFLSWTMQFPGKSLWVGRFIAVNGTDPAIFLFKNDAVLAEDHPISLSNETRPIVPPHQPVFIASGDL